MFLTLRRLYCDVVFVKTSEKVSKVIKIIKKKYTRK